MSDMYFHPTSLLLSCEYKSAKLHEICGRHSQLKDKPAKLIGENERRRFRDKARYHSRYADVHRCNGYCMYCEPGIELSIRNYFGRGKGGGDEGVRWWGKARSRDAGSSVAGGTVGE